MLSFFEGSQMFVEALFHAVLTDDVALLFTPSLAFVTFLRRRF